VGRGSARIAGIVARWARAVHRGQSGHDRRGAHLKPTVSFGLGRKSGMGSMPFKFGLKMVGIDIITRSSGGGAEGTCDTTRWAASCVPRRSLNAAFAAWLLTITRLRAHTDRACQGLQMEDCEARAGVWTHLRIEMGWGGVLVGCGSCSSRGVTATVQMRSAGSVRFMRASRGVSSASFLGV
jgi:hypothetical protein